MRDDLFEKFKEAANVYSDKIACQIKEENLYTTYTYAQLYELSQKFAAFLRQEGIEAQERVAILLENSPFWPAIYFGIAAIGATAVPIDPKLTPIDVNNILRDSQAKILFTSSELYQSLEDLLKNIPSFKKHILYPFQEVTQIGTPPEITSANKPEDIASLLYTSGTTASPKAVMLTHKNFCANSNSISELKLITAKDNILAMLPLHHSYPFMVTLITPLFTGAKITFLNSLKSEDLLKCCQETKITILVGVPQLFHLLHKSILEKIKKAPFIFSILKTAHISRALFRLNLSKIILKKLHQKFGSSLRFFASGGARLEPKVASDLHLLGFTVLEGYGLTETSPVVTFNPPHRVRFGSVGIPVPQVKIRINNPAADGIGEVLIQGPNVMKGYYKRQKETLEVLKDDWFFSGDLGYIDRQGYLHLTGRSKEVIVLSSGKNIYPEEIEAHYLKSPYIKEICVLDTFVNGIHTLHAIVLPNIDYFRKTKEVNIQGKVRWLLENLSKELPSYKRIMGFTVAKEELPRTRLGKLKRYEIKARYLGEKPQGKLQAEEEKPEEITRPRPRLENQILEYLSRALKMRVSINDHLELDLGIDSLTRVELAIGLEKLLNIDIPDTDIGEVFTVKELIEKLNQLIKRGAGAAQPGAYEPSWSQIIKEDPRKAFLDKIDLAPRLIDKLLTFILLGIIRLIFRVFWLLRIKGKENLPKNKPFIICPNHSTYLDGFFVAAAAGFNVGLNLFFLGYSGYFQHPLVSWAVKIARLIAIDPAVNLTDAMRAAAFVLRNNKSLCIFPEGERSIDGKVKDFKKGTGILIKETNCLVVPCYIAGSFQAWPRTQILPRPYPIKIIFGKPYSQDALKEIGLTHNPQDNYEAIALGLREKVIELSRTA
jgi:long-chain acyl-CoA synthetase